MKLELGSREEKAVRLALKYRNIMREIKAFIGEANCDYDGGVQELRKIASDGIFDCMADVIEEEQE